jgi:hypothetical protein
LVVLRGRIAAALLGLSWLLVALTGLLARQPGVIALASALIAGMASLGGLAWGTGRIPRRLLVLGLSGQLALLQSTVGALGEGETPALAALLLTAAVAGLADPLAVLITGAAGFGQFLWFVLHDTHESQHLPPLLMLGCGTVALGWLAGSLRRMAANSESPRAAMSAAFTTAHPRTTPRQTRAESGTESRLCMMIEQQNGGGFRLGLVLPEESDGHHTRIVAYSGTHACSISRSRQRGGPR